MRDVEVRELARKELKISKDSSNRFYKEEFERIMKERGIIKQEFPPQKTKEKWNKEKEIGVFRIELRFSDLIFELYTTLLVNPEVYHKAIKDLNKIREKVLKQVVEGEKK